MTTPPDIIDSRSANAFFENAKVSDAMFASSGQIDRGRRKQGGLWVGGHSVLTSSSLEFSPNTMNRALHADPDSLDVQLPLARITAIEVRRGLITDIIHIRSEAGDLSIRCFKAKSFAAAIEAAKGLHST